MDNILGNIVPLVHLDGNLNSSGDQQTVYRGYSAYQVALQQGFEGSKDEWLRALVGPQGETGVSVSDVRLNEDYTLTVTLDDGTEFTTESIKGDKGDKGDTGPAGATGPQGPQGQTGPKGDKGDTGEQGPKGDKGDTGEQGPKGDTGEKGQKGDTGQTGATGPQGPQGPQGETGAAFTYEDFTAEQLELLKGPQGQKGLKGDTGQKGPQGLKGDTGQKGEKGDIGPKGDTGQTGPAGPQGPQGLKGDKGDKGDTGATGAQGERGPQGIQGETGPQGPQGPQGDDYVLTEQDKQDIADIAEADLTPTILNAFPTDIASGSIASFSDGADGLPLKSLVVNIDPVQDLNGYSYPWPAGGGKNKFNGTFLQGYWAYADGTWVNSPNWITTEKIPCKASTSYTVSADAKVTRWQGFVWYDSNGDFISTDNLNSNVNIGLTKTSPSNAAYLIFNIAGHPGANDTIAPSDVTHFQLEEGSSSTAYAPYSNICPISGWTGANVYHSGADTSDATTYSITFPTEAGTVYGGTVDVTTGVLTVDRAELVVTNCLETGTASTGIPYARINIADRAKMESTGNKSISSEYRYRINAPSNSGWFRVIQTVIYIFDSRFTDRATANSILSSEKPQFVFELEEPIVYDLTPTEVKTLLGANNIFANTGDTEVEYRADTKLYIERLTAPDSADMIAVANITSGQYFMVGNSLYKATANIANGGQIIVGTNCIRKSLSEALNEINA